jgi:hypothetical protein
VYGGSLQDSIDWFSKKLGVETWKVDPSMIRYGHFSAYSPYKDGLLWFSTKYPAASVVAHECFHAVKYFADCLEAQLSDSTEELMAYYLEYLVQQVYCVKKK